MNVLKQCANIIFPLITYPYVSRILGAGNLGKYSFSDSVIGILLIFVSLGIPTYAIREGARIRDRKKEITQFSAEMFSLNIISLIIFSLLFFVLVLCIPRMQQNISLTYILYINVIANTVGRDWINSIYEDYLYLTLRYVAFQAAAVVMVLVFVRKPEDYVLYTWIMVFANSGGYIMNLFYTQKYVPVHFCFKACLKKHLKPVLYLFGVALAIEIYVKSDIAILGFLRSDNEVGIYTLSSKVYTIIKALLNAIIIASIPRISNCLGSGDHKQYYHILNKLRKWLYALVFPCVTGMFFESYNVLRLIGGEDYVAGSLALKILCMALAFSVFGCFYASAILVPNRKDRYFFFATIISAAENIVLNIVVIPFMGMAGAALTTVIAELIVVLICRHYAKPLYVERQNSGLSSVACGCIGITIVCLLLRLLHMAYFIELILAIIISAAVYVTILYFMHNEAMREILKFVKNSLSYH